MRPLDSQEALLALRSLLGGEDRERDARRIIEYVIAKASSGHVGYVRIVFNLVDGKIRPTVEEEWTFEPEWVLVVAGDEQEGGTVKAA